MKLGHLGLKRISCLAQLDSGGGGGVVPMYFDRGQTVIDWSERSGKPANVRVVDAINPQAFHDMLLRVVEDDPPK